MRLSRNFRGLSFIFEKYFQFFRLYLIRKRVSSRYWDGSWKFRYFPYNYLSIFFFFFNTFSESYAHHYERLSKRIKKVYFWKFLRNCRNDKKHRSSRIFTMWRALRYYFTRYQTCFSEASRSSVRFSGRIVTFLFFVDDGGEGIGGACSRSGWLKWAPVRGTFLSTFLLRT